MQYPKPLMTIGELTKLGFPKRELDIWVHRKDFPVIIFGTSKNSPRKIDTTQLDKWLKNNGYMRY